MKEIFKAIKALALFERYTLIHTSDNSFIVDVETEVDEDSIINSFDYNQIQ